MSLLEVRELTRRFGGLLAVNKVSFEVREGEILSIIGPNGAGKSTLFKLVAGALRPNSGEVFFRGENITGLPQHVIARKGLVRTFQETTVFREMTVLEHVVVAHHLHSRVGNLGIFLGTAKARLDEEAFRKSAEEILEYLGLTAFRHEQARNLPHGHLRAVGIAMAMAANPKVLLLDEPFSGMNPEETQQGVELVRGLRDRGVTVLLVEHDMSAVMQISDRIVVLNFGQKIAEGAPGEIQGNEGVIEAYLGREDYELGV
ncbi:MAG: ABC transporter ATP-binding protein [Meiothermus silvanus]|nr:ABC transporter ATP-binding protein [Allomeiothermus silvanus]